ncbi:peptide chain release factor N(5)-glutamine methyltransferase [Desulfovibrio sp. OttesenSCG-928-G15]|nr:peptide chain release factor N(5)-glutamine methyltransferase [Desulfovibrio sp. OttesenSCG-928-G15]
MCKKSSVSPEPVKRLPERAVPRVALGLLAERLSIAGADSPRLSAEVLLAHALGLERSDFLKKTIMEPDVALEAKVLERAFAYAARRENGEPVAYITGSREFYGRNFALSPETLIPRPETELLVDAARECAAHAAAPGLFADLGTGSGCLAVSVALELPGWIGLAVDRSAGALEIARCNAATHGARTVHFVRADFHALPVRSKSLRLILANPPYVSEEEYSSLDREVRAYEPKSALVPAVGGQEKYSRQSGLEDVAGIIATVPALLEPGGWLLMEIGAGQGDACRDLLQGPAWQCAEVRPDLAGLDRMVVAQAAR